MKFEWKEIHRNNEDEDTSDIITHRAKVIGGWIVKATHIFLERGEAISICFVPDIKHKWKL